MIQNIDDNVNMLAEKYSVAEAAEALACIVANLVRLQDKPEVAFQFFMADVEKKIRILSTSP